jgi:hypothetical protein
MFVFPSLTGTRRFSSRAVIASALTHSDRVEFGVHTTTTARDDLSALQQVGPLLAWQDLAVPEHAPALALHQIDERAHQVLVLPRMGQEDVVAVMGSGCQR